MRVGEQPQAFVEERPLSSVVLVMLREALVHVSEACPDAVLMPLQRGQVDGVGEVRGEQLVALGFKSGPVCREVSNLLVTVSHALVERRIHPLGKVAVGLIADRERDIGVSDEAFGDRDRHRPARTAGLLRSTAGADEVGVRGASRVGCEVQQHPGPTGPAVQQSFEVVGVLDVPGCMRVSRLQERLHAIKQGGFDQWLVRAGMQDALVADHSCVVGVGEQFVECVLPQRLRGTLRGRHRDQPTCGQVTQQPRHRGLALGVVLERPPDERGTVGIDLHCPDLAAVLIGATHVEVANRGTHRRAALGDLLRKALGHFGGEVPGVELRDARHDAVDQHPRGRLIDGLRCGHEGDPSGKEGFVDLHVVSAVAGEPVELVPDAERDTGRGDERQHLSETVTVGGARRFAGIYELTHDPRSEFCGLPLVRFALRRDREPLRGATTLGLLTRGHAHIRDSKKNGRSDSRLGGCGVACGSDHG